MNYELYIEDNKTDVSKNQLKLSKNLRCLLILRSNITLLPIHSKSWTHYNSIFKHIAWRAKLRRNSGTRSNMEAALMVLFTKLNWRLTKKRDVSNKAVKARLEKNYKNGDLQLTTYIFMNWIPNNNMKFIVFLTTQFLHLEITSGESHGYVNLGPLHQ